MESISLFFKNLTVSKKLLLMTSPVVTFFINMKLAILGMLFLIFIDLLTGIRKSHIKNGMSFEPFKKRFWMHIRSDLLRKTYRKAYEYIFGIIAISVVELWLIGRIDIEILGHTKNLTTWSIVVGGLIELWSIFENMEAVSGNNPLKKLSSILPERVREIFDKTKPE